MAMYNMHAQNSGDERRANTVIRCFVFSKLSPHGERTILLSFQDN